ncbi:MAG: Z1 domain-containing protein [Treponemataceae bacterium]|nr:Z1 domain-containing protein [Treponemataceae bacterium]
MEVRIQKENKPDSFTPVFGERATELYSRFTKLSAEELETSKNETISILSNCADPKSGKPQSVTSLVVGYVQSGKTMSFTALSALASDSGYRIIIYFAGNKNNLLEQTTKRLRKDLINEGNNRKWYKLHQNPKLEDLDRIANELQMSTNPTVLITVLKQHQHIKDISDMFGTSRMKNVLKNDGVMIIDDEADQASLNGYAYKNSKSEEWEDDEYTTTYRRITELRSSLPNHSYIQYTATPQGPLLISIMDLLSPKHHTVLTPGKSYTGGKTFFKENPGLIIEIPKEETYHSKRNNLSQPPKTLITALQLHILSVAVVVQYKEDEKFLSMMVHADKEQDASEKFHNWVSNIINGWITTFNLDKNDIAFRELLSDFENTYPMAIQEYKAKNIEYPVFSDIASFIPDIIKDTNIELIISRNKKNGENKEIPWNDYSSHILVGADMLNRGFTVENLATTYMPRYTIGKSNADTIQQRCRFFGYKQKYLLSCRVFLPRDVRQEYTEYVDHEEEMRKWLKGNDSLENVEHLLLTSPSLNATRRNILTKEVVINKLNGWRKMNAFQTNSIEGNKNTVDTLFSKHEDDFKLYKKFGTDDRDHRYLKLDIDEVIQFLSDFRCQNMPDAARKQATVRYLKYLSSLENGNPLKFAYIIQMAYKSEPRKRAFDTNTERLSTYLFSGHSPSGKNVYPGDMKICFEDSICIQIHNIELSCESKKWKGKTAYTLAIYYPDDFAVNYVG